MFGCQLPNPRLDLADIAVIAFQAIADAITIHAFEYAAQILANFLIGNRIHIPDHLRELAGQFTHLRFWRKRKDIAIQRSAFLWINAGKARLVFFLAHFLQVHGIGIAIERIKSNVGVLLRQRKILQQIFALQHAHTALAGHIEKRWRMSHEKLRQTQISEFICKLRHGGIAFHLRLDFRGSVRLTLRFTIWVSSVCPTSRIASIPAWAVSCNACTRSGFRSSLESL
jgi:hypothetical protein